MGSSISKSLATDDVFTRVVNKSYLASPCKVTNHLLRIASKVTSHFVCDQVKSQVIFLSTMNKESPMTMGDSSYTLNFDQGKKKERQHHS